MMLTLNSLNKNVALVLFSYKICVCVCKGNYAKVWLHTRKWLHDELGLIVGKSLSAGEESC